MQSRRAQLLQKSPRPAPFPLDLTPATTPAYIAFCGQAGMAKGTFGEHLRREREMRGVSLEEIANATRISTRFLVALENERWDQLPGGVFNRGFIRAIAHFLGLDDDGLLQEYVMATNDGPAVAVWADTPAKPRRRVWPWLLALLLVALAVGGWFAYRQFGARLRAWIIPKLEAPPAPAVVSEPAPAPQAPVQVSAAPEETPADAPPLELKIEAGRGTAITVAADGETVFDGHMEPGESRRFQARQRFEVSARNSTAVLLELNGQTLPPLGPPGEPGKVTLSRKDLKAPPGGQD